MQEQYGYSTGEGTMGLGAMPEAVESQGQVPLPPGVALEQVRTLTRKAIDARKSTIGDKWRFHRRLYNNDFDWTGKRRDQSQHPVAELARAVDWKAQALVDALTSNAKDPFDLEPDTELADLVSPIYQACISANLDRENFPTLVQDALISGMLTSGCVFRVYPDPTRPPESGYSRIEVEVMERVFRDPTGRGKWKVRITPYDLADVQQMAVEQGWDAEQVALLEHSSSSSPETEVWREEAGDLVSYASIEQDGYRNTVFLTEYWGPVWEYPGGPLWAEYARVVLADNQYELLVQRDPYGDGKSDIVDGDLNPRATFPYGKSEVEDCVPMAEMETRLLNSIADNIAWSTAHINEINEGLFTQDTAKALKGSIKAGQSIPKNGQGDLIQPKPLATPNPMALEFYAVVNQLFQKFSAASDLAQGIDTQGANGDNTATESRIVQGNASQTLKGMARAVESRVIRPLIERMLYYLITYGDFNSEWIQRVAAKQIEAAKHRLMKELLEGAPPEVGEQPMPPPTAVTDPMTGEETQVPDEGDPVYQLANRQWQMQAQQAMQEWEQRAEAFAVQKLQEAWRQPCSVRVRGISGVLEREGKNEQMQSIVGAIASMDPSMIDVPKVALALCRNVGIHAGDILVSDSEDGLRQKFEENRQMQAQQAMATTATEVPPKQSGNGKEKDKEGKVKA